MKTTFVSRHAVGSSPTARMAVSRLTLLSRPLQLVLRIDNYWVHQGSFPILGFSLKAVLHVAVNLSTVLSTSCGSVVLLTVPWGGYSSELLVTVPIGPSGVCEACRQGRIKGQYCFNEPTI